MEKRVVSILLMLSLEALLLVAGLSAAAAGSGDMDIIRLPTDAKSGFAEEVMAMARGKRPGEEERPWKCCDLPLCAKIWPPYCQCLDRVEQCSDACKNCKKVEGSDPSRHTCGDWYRGEPGPMCKEDEDNHVIVDFHGDSEEVAVVTGAKTKSDERPWKCCDRAVPGPSTSEDLVWYCMDEVDRCDCERCLEVKDTDSYFCLDGYGGRDPGPKCTHDG